MRIGFDMFAVQSPDHGARGIGRYSENLVSTLLNRDDGHEYVLYVHEDLPSNRVPVGSNARIRTVAPSADLGDNPSALMDRLLLTNPDELDAFVVLSPFERWRHYTPPAHPRNGVKMLAVVYDLIPFLFQNESDPDPQLRHHFHVLENLTRYDALLAISEWTQRDVRTLLRLPSSQVVNISTASDPAYFVPDRDDSPSPESESILKALGIDKPFLLNVGGVHPRKNLPTLIEAFSNLPTMLREQTQLVITCKLGDYGRNWLTRLIQEFGVEDSVILTDEVSDETLRILYQRCRVFVFPSSYEGFGLPLLEAMHCGAAVIAGNNSSQIEVVGEAGLLVDADNADEIKTRIVELLESPALVRELGDKAILQAETFSWERTASLALKTVTDLRATPSHRARVRLDRAHHRKPTIAFFSPLPPRKSGISDYSSLLLEELRNTYEIDLFHDKGYLPEPALAHPELMACDYRLFDRFAAAKNYHAIVYQMGNSSYHSFMFPILQRHRGVVTLHDFCLAGFHLHYGRQRGEGDSFLRNELLAWYPDDREAILQMLALNENDHEKIVKACATNGWYLNHRILEGAQTTIVHSPWCETQVRERSPQYAERTRVIPFGITPRPVDAVDRAEIRRRFLIPHDALVFAAFGFVHSTKMCVEAIEAFVPIAGTDDKAILLFVGEEFDGGAARRFAAEIGVADRVRFMGRQSTDAFDSLMNITDLGINLRLPPTNGETSAALLNLLASGVPTVITDVATFSDLPSHIVRKVRWETEGLDGIKTAFHELATDRYARQALGRAAWAYVDKHHAWSRVAGLYVDAIECRHEKMRGLEPNAIRRSEFRQTTGRAAHALS